MPDQIQMVFVLNVVQVVGVDGKNGAEGKPCHPVVIQGVKASQVIVTDGLFVIAAALLNPLS